jgi:LPXTG-motif cell wall-anchored protein
MAAATMSLGVASAPVDASDILVSSDGVTFTRSLGESLFDELAFLVPTESTTSELWVKNPTDFPASVRISLEDADLGPGVFADNLTLTSLVEDSGTTRSATLRELDRCGVIVVSEPLAGSGTLRVRFTAALGDLPGLSGQNESTSIVLRIDMRDSQAGGFPQIPCNDGGSTAAAPSAERSMAATGADASIPLTAAGLLLASGILVHIARRRHGPAAQ